MKPLRLFFIVSFTVCTVAPTAFSQDPQQASNYVVIGAFAKLDHAVKLTHLASLESFQAQYAINAERKLYYVFILNTADRKRAFAFVLKIRVETKYKDAWVFSGKLGEDMAPNSTEIKSEPIVEEKADEPVITELIAEELPKKDAITVSPILIDSSTLKKPVEESLSKEPVEVKPAGKPFYFKLVNSESGNEVTGEVQVVESKATQYIGFKGNEIVYLIPPKNSAGVYQVTIQAPGYKTAKLAINYNDPSAASSGTGEKQETIVTFELVRAKKGDYIDFNNVRFFRNATILEPGSQNELDGLASLLKENPKYKVKIHGHCNGDGSRDIITMGSSTAPFALDPAQNKKQTSSAKVLTELRAEAVKNYLVSRGIESDRLSTKGEGGKMMIYSVTSTLANYNDRVEIEILKGK